MTHEVKFKGKNGPRWSLLHITQSARSIQQMHVHGPIKAHARTHTHTTKRSAQYQSSRRLSNAAASAALAAGWLRTTAAPHVVHDVVLQVQLAPVSHSANCRTRNKHSDRQPHNISGQRQASSRTRKRRNQHAESRSYRAPSVTPNAVGA